MCVTGVLRGVGCGLERCVRWCWSWGGQGVGSTGLRVDPPKSELNVDSSGCVD